MPINKSLVCHSYNINKHIKLESRKKYKSKNQQALRHIKWNLPHTVK